MTFRESLFQSDNCRGVASITAADVIASLETDHALAEKKARRLASQLRSELISVDFRNYDGASLGSSQGTQRCGWKKLRGLICLIRWIRLKKDKSAFYLILLKRCRCSSEDLQRSNFVATWMVPTTPALFGLGKSFVKL